MLMLIFMLTLFVNITFFVINTKEGYKFSSGKIMVSVGQDETPTVDINMSY